MKFFYLKIITNLLTLALWWCIMRIVFMSYEVMHMVSKGQVIDKEVRKVLAEFPQFIVRRGSKHLKITDPATGRIVDPSF